MQRVQATKEGMMIDQVVAGATGSDAGGRVEATLQANPGMAATLAMAAHELALGAVLVVPERSTAPLRLATIKLWD